MKLFSKICILLTTILVVAASCGDEPDGLWEKMKWTNVNNLMNINGVYYIPEEGGTFSFLCRNYSHPWFSSIFVDGIEQQLNENLHEYHGEWISVKFEDNNLIITAEPLPGPVESRVVNLDVTAGDIFDNLVFSQKKNVY